MSREPVKKRILIISHDKVGPSMAGPGIRYHQMANILSKNHSVTLGVFNPKYIDGLHGTSYSAIDIHVQHFDKVFVKYDVIIALWLSDEMIEFAKSKKIKIIFDLYAPVPVEDLVQRVFGSKTDAVSDYDYSQMLSNYSHFLRNGDFFLTSNLQQRDLWIGYAFASGMTAPSKQNKRGIDSYFGICPMGIDPDEYVANDTELLTSRIPSIKPTDFVVVWTGGIWDWFDARSPIKAIHALNKNHPDIKLVFLGTKHPNDDVPAMEETELARRLAKDLKIIDKNVFFLDGWLPYAERTKYLRRANAALYAHMPSVEARFSHRTRVLDHILMNLPTIATRGDYFADLIEEKNLGITVSPFDEKSLASAILKLKTDKKMSDKISGNINKVKVDFYWENTLSDLVEFLAGDEYEVQDYSPRQESKPADGISKSHLVKTIKKQLPRPIKNVIKRVIKQR